MGPCRIIRRNGAGAVRGAVAFRHRRRSVMAETPNDPLPATNARPAGAPNLPVPLEVRAADDNPPFCPAPRSTRCRAPPAADVPS